MRHAKDPDLDRLDGLLARLRDLEPLRERDKGNSSPARAFLHFHADGDDRFADVRLGGVDFERRRVTNADEEADLVSAIAARAGEQEPMS